MTAIPGLSIIVNANIKAHIALEFQSIISLPRHSKPEYVVAWLDRVLGRQDSPTVRPFRPVIGSSLWNGADSSYLGFTDFVGQAYEWEMVEGDGGLVLYPPLNELTRTLAPKLVQFFGGKVWWLGPITSKPQDIDVQEGQQIYPIPPGGQAIDNRQLEKLLGTQPVLSLVDLMSPKENSHPNYRRLFGALESWERRENLVAICQASGITPSGSGESLKCPSSPLAF